MRFRFDRECRILNIRLSDDVLEIDLEGGYRIVLRDHGQQCCEDRYLHTDDELPCCVGECFRSLAHSWVEAKEDEHGDFHEIAFLHLTTNRRVCTIEAHNVHNGYYSGFDLDVELQLV